MKTIEKNILTTTEESFQEYYELVPQEATDKNTVVIVTEWKEEGDSFKKFSLYDNNYTPVSISSSTSFICNL